MKFEEIIPHLLEGETVRRFSKTYGLWRELHVNDFVSSADYEADDWEAMRSL